MIRKEVKTLFGSSGAVFSDCESYRYLLWRNWDESMAPALLLLMNPSTADETEDDKTVARQIERVRMWPQIGFPYSVGGLEVANVFAYRETDSTKLAGLHASGFDLVGSDNDDMLVEAARRAQVVVCGWGVPGKLGGRDIEVLELLKRAGVQPYALKFNSDGSPKHPLYVKLNATPVPIPI
jgi:hypothetical protein